MGGRLSRSDREDIRGDRSGEDRLDQSGDTAVQSGAKKIIEARFPGNNILNAEMVLGFDDKLRYHDRLRYLIYRFLIDALTEYSRTLPIYLCMEERSMWEELKLPFPFGRLTVDGGPGK